MLQTIFPQDRICLDLVDTAKPELFAVLVSKLNQTLFRPLDFMMACNALQVREARLSTAIGNGIAIPHAKITGINEVLGVVGISRTGITYKASDDKPVQLIFLLLSPADTSDKHLHALKLLATALEKTTLRDDILAGSSDTALIWRCLQAADDAIR
ncbi:MAG: hypothetical protein A2087_00730 [Spirochaetes bacterium GWD1_61_31]|nr:MAG: hypothetical protein A2Y37_03155 [Spirochaetes bacterium GWB1_60_80]OHD29610.1 MAG: hypothetical protein A2004_01695 [Spirochaetes bacterium GWC1_61_12]OHD37513.1 MAG: hypothetical protein A2087_00730 [Spirochaetes bacterium GWD1_61_31]OHD41977.1 MAG: hypothetical protein A2Y35_14535 [Spirochaetes bacterium GWE1_60_18]OHD61757.1 MAG: hypothetical protein A2Y32_13415 [Spirochaetes bacterium GWF1_60_12]